jgi:hypothetical protein
MGLGAYPIVSLATAREKTLACKRSVANGLNPRDERDKVKTELKAAKAHSVTFEKAARIGNRDILWWLRLEGCPWNARTFSSAINGDADLLTLKWLHHEKCPWGVEAFIAAVKRGDLEILRWLREKQCPWDAEFYLAAVEKKNGEVLQWLRQEKCPLTETTVDLLIQNLKSCYESK